MVPAQLIAGSDCPGREDGMFFLPFFHSRRCGNWRYARAYAAAGCGPNVDMSMSDGDFGGGASIGVRRPLRFLAWKLDLDEKQVTELAKVLADIKTERAQAAVDERRAAGMLADLAGAGEFDQAKANEVAGLRVKSAERVQEALVKTLSRLHSILSPEQREKLAYLIRTGTLQL